MQLASQAEAQRSQELFDKKVISEKEHTNKIQLNESNAAKVEALKANVEQAQLNLNFCKVTSPVEALLALREHRWAISSEQRTARCSLPFRRSIQSRSSFRSAKRNISGSEPHPGGIAMPLDKRPEFIDLILADGKTFPNKARLLGRPAGERFDRDDSRDRSFKNPGSVLRPGLFARARITASTLKDAVVVPQRAVMEVKAAISLPSLAPTGRRKFAPCRSGRAWARTG